MSSDRDEKQKIIAAHKFYRAMALDPVKAARAPAIEELKPKRAYTKSEGPSEHDEQVKVIEWWWQQGRAWGHPVISLFAVPNAQALIKFATNRNAFLTYMKKEGMRSGALDLVLAIPSGEYHGMFLEMKRLDGGVVSPEQKEYVSVLREYGYHADVYRGGDAAIAAITDYLKGRI